MKKDKIILTLFLSPSRVGSVEPVCRVKEGGRCGEESMTKVNGQWRVERWTKARVRGKVLGACVVSGLCEGRTEVEVLTVCVRMASKLTSIGAW